MDALHRILPEKNFLEITDMTMEEGKEVFTIMLSRAGRTLTEAQMNLVMHGFEGAKTPLYLKVYTHKSALFAHAYVQIIGYLHILYKRPVCGINGPSLS